MANFVYPEEVSYFVESIRPFEIKDVGSTKWLEVHEMIIRLSQQALIEAAEYREEYVKEMLIASDKLKILVHEGFCVSLWKTKVLPHLLDIDPNPLATFLIYTVFFYEASVISLLEMALYHESGCEALKDSAIDLVDYCAQAVAQVIGLASMGYLENESNYDADDSILTELERQKRDLIFKIGIKCVSIFNYLADHVDSLPIGASRRMVVTHDIPWLMVDLLTFRPWQRKTKRGVEKYIDEKWTAVKSEALTQITKHEAQAWFCLRQILFKQELMQSYKINDIKRNHLAKCLGLLHETLLDQLPPLIELKQYLCQLSAVGSQPNDSEKSDLILEELPQIREHLIGETEKSGGFLGIAQLQEKIFLTKDNEEIFVMAQRLNAAYNTDFLAELEAKTEESDKKFHAVNDSKQNAYKCNNCFGEAEKKCSKCRTVYYCSRKCQLDDWNKHKQSCLKL